MMTTTQTAIANVIAAAQGLVARAGELKLIGNSDKQYAVLRVAKIHTREQLKVALEHDLREAHAPNADPDGLGIEVIAGPRTVARALARFDDIIERVNDGEPVVVVKNGRKPVLALEIVMDGPANEMWLTWDEAKRKAWKRAQVEWLRKYFPSEGRVMCVVHMDESRVHATAILVPLAHQPVPQALARARQLGLDGSDLPRRWVLSAKSFVGTHRLHLRRRQTEYAEAMADFGLIRGRFVEETKAVHIPNKVYRAKAAALCAGLERTIGDLLEVVEAHVGLTNEAAKAKREAEALREQMSAAMRSEQEAIALMHRQANETIEREAAEAKARAKQEALAEMTAERERLERDTATIAAERKKLEEDRKANQIMIGLAAKAAEQKAEIERLSRDLADLNQSLTAERGRLGLLSQRLENGQRELTAAQAKLAVEQKAAKASLAKLAAVEAREARVAAREEAARNMDARLGQEQAAMAAGSTLLANQRQLFEADRAKADARLAGLQRAATNSERAAREAAEAFRRALAQVPLAYRAAVHREAARGLERLPY